MINDYLNRLVAIRNELAELSGEQATEIHDVESERRYTDGYGPLVQVHCATANAIAIIDQLLDAYDSETLQ